MLVICNGMMRAGSTLQYNLTNAVLGTAGPVQRLGFFLDPHEIQHHRQLTEWLKSPAWHTLKMHRYWSGGSAELQIRRCYVYRDIRDVAASALRKFPVTWPELLGILDEAIELDAVIRTSPNVIVQRYEFMITAPSDACSELASYFDVSLCRDECERLAFDCIKRTQTSSERIPAIRRMFHYIARQQTLTIKRVLGLAPPAVRRRLGNNWLLGALRDNLTRTRSESDADTLMHVDHFSSWRGRPGAWREYFDRTQQETLQSRYASWLCENDYSLADF